MTKEKKSQKPKKQAVEEVKEITLEYKLHELPSSQHKAGLAGLVLMVRWLTKRNPHKVKGILEEIECTKNTYKLRIDKDGMKSLFDETYSASWEEQEREKVIKNPRTKKEIPYKRKEMRTIEMIDKRTGNRILKEKEVFIYDIVVPSGSFLAEIDSSSESAWMKLWRDMVWNILRGIPKTRIVYENRANKVDNKDYLTTWNSLVKPTSKKSEIQGTYFLGAQDKNAEGVPFLDMNKNFLVLRLWPFIAQIYIPQKLEYDNSTKKYKQSDDGFTICMPEITDLNNFCIDYEQFLKSRDNSMLGYRPKAARINIIEEAGWDSLERLKISLTKLEGSKLYSDLISGIDVFRFVKEGNNINNKANLRIRPNDAILKEYEAFKNDNYFDPVFKRQCLRNIAEQKDWFNGFDRILFTTNPDYFFRNGFFARDVGKKLKGIIINSKKENKSMTEEEVLEEKPELLEKQSKEEIIYWMVWSYISQKLKTKHGLTKENSKSRDYAEKKEELAKKIFLGMRGKSGKDFIEYFVTSICDVGQYMNVNRYMEFQNFLYQETDKVKVLTMLALSGISYSYQKEEKSND